MANLHKIEPKLKALPDAPGVYRFLSASGQVLYVGKSKHLRNRVRSYFVPSQKWEKVQEMLPFIDDLEVTICDTHLEARLLECELIKQLTPRFNAQYKGDSRYVFLDLGPDRLPRITGRRTPDAVGPFRSQWNLRAFLDSLRLLYPLRETSTSVTIAYQPLPPRLTEADLAATCSCLNRVFRIPSTCEKLIQAIEEQMKLASDELRFEQALFYRELLPTLRRIQKNVGSLAEFISSEYYVRIPLAKGARHFFIRRGLVQDSVYHAANAADVADEPYEADVPDASDAADAAFSEELFLFMARALPEKEVPPKARLDYCDIVFTELENLPAEQVRKLTPPGSR